MLQAKPLKGQQLTSSMMDDSVSIIRNRVDGLGVSEPVITKQGTNQIVVELPAVHNATQAAKIIGQTAQLELYDLTPSLYGPSIDAQQDAVPHTSLFDLLTLVQTGPEGRAVGLLPLQLADEEARRRPRAVRRRAEARPVVISLEPQKAKTVTVKTGHGKNAKTTTQVVKPGKTTAGFPTGYQVLTAPNRTVVITCDSPVRRRACPGVGTGLRLPASPTTTSSSTASTRSTRRARSRR